MQIRHKLRLATTLGLAAGALTLGLVAPSAVSGAATPKGTLTLAEGPGAQPDYIFPFMSCTYFSVANINAFQFEMYRPLYWFGYGANATYTPSLSVASTPVFSGGNKTITINMKGWKFADGQTINAESVMFFLNMYHAEKTNYCGYNAGYGIPDQMSSASGSGNKVILHFSKSVNPNWILYNYLSEITPMANSWDLTAANSPSTCATGAYGTKATDTACTAVYTYLAKQAGTQSTYTGAMWQSGVSGPYKMTHFDNIGNVTFVPNSAYSGPQKSMVASVVELPFTTAAAEEVSLREGRIDLGYVDTTNLTQNGTPSHPGANWAPVASKYNLEVGAPWSVDYAAYNFKADNPNSKYLNQLYVRQALQLTVDQPLMIQKIQKGYGYQQINPLPPVTSKAISGPVSTKNPYPYSPAKALGLLTSHGWVLNGGSATCQKPGTSASECGKGISKGNKLNVALEYGSGIPQLAVQVATEVSEWKSIGINATTLPEPFNKVVGDCVSKTTNWSICLWGAGWIYAPDYYPSGESLFVPGASFNIGAYSYGPLTAAVKTTTFGTASLATFANIAAQQLPVLYQPNTTDNYVQGGIGEAIKTLKSKIGFTPNTLENFMPEYYYF
ncbi:MAG TPA: ABC transporter substrate-binding protein [Acidimicrobiales bacterium]